MAESGTLGDDQRRWFTQGLLVPGEEAYVYGEAHPRDAVSSPDNPENLVVEPVSEDEASLAHQRQFHVSDRSEAALRADRSGGTATVLVVIGGLFVAGGLGLLVNGLL